MNLRKNWMVAATVAVLLVIAVFAYQNWSANQGMTTARLITPISEENEAFDVSDPSVEETRKFPLEVLAIKPEAEDVAEVRQVFITFNKPMVALGDFEKAADKLPVKIVPEIPCHWRWLNRQSLGCQLDQALPPSNKYQVKVSKGFAAFDGTQLKTDREAVFTTSRWKVVQESIEWKDADLPVLVWTFDQPMQLQSLQEQVSSKCGDLKVSAVSKEVAEKWSLDPDRTYMFAFTKKIGLDQSCAVTLAHFAQALQGKEPGRGHSRQFQTFPEFKISQVNCQYGVHSKEAGPDGFLVKGCDPDNSVSIQLTSPVYARDLVNKIKVEPFFGWSQGGVGSPEYFQQYPDQLSISIDLRSPLNGRSEHKINIDLIKDQFGRKLQGARNIVISTIDFNPHLSVTGDFGVMEKHGPHQLAYSAVNVKAFNLRYFHSQSPSDLRAFNYYQNGWEFCQGKSQGNIPLTSHILSTGAQLNTPVTRPIDFDEVIPAFQYGFLFGNIHQTQSLDGVDAAQKNYLKDFCRNFFLVVTDLGITAKVGFYDSGVWVHSIGSGKPLSGIKVQMRGFDRVLTEGTTDSSGFVKLDGAIQWDPERETFRNWGTQDYLFVTAETKDDLSVLPFYQGTRGISPYSFSDYETENYFYSTTLSKSGNHIVHAISDRPLYQPGQGVKLKYFARHWEPRTFGLAPATEMNVVVRDARGKEIFKDAVKLSEYGTASSALSLDAGAPLGNYSVSASIGEKWSQTIGNFEVQEFTLPPFKVSVDSIKSRFLVGASAAFRTSAQYHFGGALADQKGKYSAIFQEQGWSPSLPQWKSFNFDDPESLNLTGYEKQRSLSPVVLEEGNLKTDKNGDAFKQILISPNQVRSYGTLVFESMFQDDRGKTIANRAQSKVYYADFHLGLKKDQWSYEAGERIRPEAILLNHEEKPVAGQKLNFKLVHRSYQTVRVRGTGNYFGYETKTTDRVVDSCQVTSKDDTVTCNLKAKAAGNHFIIAEVEDSKRRWARASLHAYITGEDYVGWGRENHDRIDVVPDKESYKVGEELSLLVKNPYSEVNAIFTLERFGILKQFRRKLSQGAEVVKIPLDSKDYAPGFYVSVHLIKGRVSEKILGGVDLGKPSFKMGMAKIKVVNPDSLLQIEAQAKKTEYEPGQEVEVELAVRSEDGRRKSELSVAVVDEKILQLSGAYQTAFNLHDKFYALPGVEVMTSQMLSYLIGRRHFGRKGAPEGGDGDGLQLRKDFLPIAYWNPALETNFFGQAKVKFKAPDNLTTWRVLVLAVDKEHRFGFNSGTFKVNQKLMIEPALPSFLTEGDSLKGRFSVFNKTGRESQVTGQLKVTGLTLDGSDTRDVKVADQSKEFLEWNLKAPFESRTATLELRAEAKASGDKDAARYDFPIRPFVSYETFAHYGSSTEEKVSIPLEMPKNIRNDLGGLELILSPTLISHLDDVFRYSLNYPYSCWEQKLVKALTLNSYIGLKEYVTLSDLDRNPEEWIKDLLNEMPHFQADNGGMSYWKSDLRTVDPYLSVFTSLGMLWLNQAKVPIPKVASEKVFAYTDRLLKGKERFPEFYSPAAKATVLAMAAYVRSLMGVEVTAAVNRLYQDQKLLSLFGKSFLWSASNKSENTRAVAEALKKDIFSMADLTSGQIQFQELIDDGFQRILHSTTRSNCRLLTGLLEQDSQGPFVEPLVRWIIGTRKANRWNNTQENLFCLNAIVDYAKIFEKDIPDFKVSAQVLGKPLVKAQFSGFKQEGAQQSLALSEVKADLNAAPSLDIEKKGKGRVYYTARMKVAYKDVRPDPVNAGMQVERHYSLKGADGKWIRQAPQAAVRLSRGDLVRVELKVILPSTRYHVALVDSLPAGLEPLNTALASTSQSEAMEESEDEDEAGGYYWDEDGNWFGLYFSGGFYHREMRLFGAQYFADFISRGEYNLHYIAQAIAVGSFNVPPAMVEQMYDPEVYGKSTPAQFTIVE